MQEVCVCHQETPLALCLNKQCVPTLLCLRCIQDHTKDHNSDTIEKFKLEKDDKWLETYEQQREELKSQIDSLFVEREFVISQYKELLAGSIDEIFKSEESANLEQDLQNLKNCNFREGEFFSKVQKVKTFFGANSYTAEHIISFRESLDKMKLNDTQATTRKEELIKLLKKFVKGETLVNQETTKDEKELNSLKEEYQKYKQETENKIKNLQKENNDLKAKNKPAPAPKKEEPQQKQNEVSKKENEVQKKEVEAPKQNEAPKKEDEVPKKENEAPKKEAQIPKKQNQPKKQNEVPKKEVEAPKPKTAIQVPEVNNQVNEGNVPAAESDKHERKIEGSSEEKEKEPVAERTGKQANPAPVERAQSNMNKVDSKKQLVSEEDAAKLAK